MKPGQTPPAAPANPNPKAAEEVRALPAAAQKWLGNRTIASQREEGGYITIVSYPDYQKETFKK
jgi:hypothetical protein